jgi:hypothetical protein
MANFQHREYLGTVNATTGFALTKYSVNPGVSSTFPWLGQVANNFEKYKINRMSFVFNSTASDSVTNGSNSSVGVLILGASYDSADPDFASRFEMLNYRGTRSQKLSSSFQFPVDTRMFQQQNLWVRDGPAPVNTDIRLYDACTFYLATDAAQGGYACGELWVVYDIDLMGPKLYDTIQTITNYARFEGDAAISTCPLGNAGVTGGPYTIANTMGVWLSGNAETLINVWNTIHVPNLEENKYFRVLLVWRDSANTTTAGRAPPAYTTLTNCTNQNFFNNNTQNLGNSATQTVNVMMRQDVFKITTVGTGLPVKVQLDNGLVLAGGQLNCYIEITAIPTSWLLLRSAGTGITTNIDIAPIR